MDHAANLAPARGLRANVATFQQAGGVVFDCDGVLTDTTPCWDDAFSRVASELDLALSREQLAELHGAALSTAAGRLSRWSPRPPRQEKVLGLLREQLVRAISAADLLLADGVRELLNELYGAVSLGVASNSPRPVLLHILGRLEITEYFASAISGEDVAHPKPAPDPYLAVCKALAVDSHQSFAIEDSEIGMRSALAAGLTVIELAASPVPPPDGRLQGTLRVRSLADPRVRQLVFSSAAAPSPPARSEHADDGR
jgi:HAD superfamily hydrolase (TIGR01509 family)